MKTRFALIALGVILELSLYLTLPAEATDAAVIALNNEGVRALNVQNFQLAVQKFEEALKLDPGYQNARNNLAIAYNNFGLKMPLPEKIKWFHKALTLQPDNATTKANVTGVIRLLGKDPNSFRDRVQLARDARLAADFDGAIIEYRAALAIQNDASARSNLAEILRVRELPDAAIAEYKTALALEKDDSARAAMYVQMGQCYQSKNDLTNACAAYTSAVRLKPQDQDARNALKAGWEAALMANPQSPENHVGYGQSLQVYGDFGQAEAEYKLALKFDPNNGLAKQLLASLSAAKSDTNVAKHVNNGVDLQIHKDYDGAITEYLAAQKLDPTNVAIWMNIGTALQSKGDMRRAKDCYRKVLERDPGHKDALKAIQVLTDNGF